MKKLKSILLSAVISFTLAASATGAPVYASSDASASGQGETQTQSESETESESDNIKNGLFETKDGKTYYYKNGERNYGEQKVDGHWMYFSKKNGAAKNQFVYFKKGKRLCYYNKKGYRLSGSHKVKGVKCRFSASNGKLVSGRTDLLQKYIGTAKKGKKIAGIRDYTPGSKAKKKLKAAVKSIEKKGCSVSFVMIDVNTLQGVSYNPNKKYYSASTIKGPYIASVVSKKSGVLSSKKGTIKKILKYSDNDAYVSFAKHYGFSYFNKYVKAAGATYKRSGGNRCYAYYSAKNLAKLWTENYSYFQSNATGRSLGKMFESPNVSAIHSALSGKYKTRTKAGWMAWNKKHNATHDAGVVYSDDGNYIIVVMSNMPSKMGSLKKLVRALDYTHRDMVK